jgi:hypothetical protein
LTSDDMIILSSEVGVTDVDESTIIKKERLHPGKMLLIDTEKGKIISDEEIKKEEALHKPYAEWVKKTLVEIDNLPLNTDKKGDTWHDLVHKLKNNAKGNVNEHLLLKNFIVLENMFVNRENSEDKLSFKRRSAILGRMLTQRLNQSLKRLTIQSVQWVLIFRLQYCRKNRSFCITISNNCLHR